MKNIFLLHASVAIISIITTSKSFASETIVIKTLNTPQSVYSSFCLQLKENANKTIKNFKFTAQKIDAREITKENPGFVILLIDHPAGTNKIGLNIYGGGAIESFQLGRLKVTGTVTQDKTLNLIFTDIDQ